MKADLNHLIINDKEFKEITGIHLKEIRDTIEREKKTAFQKYQKLILDFWIFLAFAVLYTSLLLCPIVWVVSKILGALIISWELDFSSALRISTCLSLPIATTTTFNHFSKAKEKKKTLKHLQLLFEDFDSYNRVVEAIDVKDKLEEVGAVKSDIEGRETLLQVLTEMKQELICALKVERILRENQSIIKLNPEVFETTFTAPRIRQVLERGTEYDRSIGTALKIGVSVKQKIDRMRND